MATENGPSHFFSPAVELRWNWRCTYIGRFSAHLSADRWHYRASIVNHRCTKWYIGTTRYTSLIRPCQDLYSRRRIPRNINKFQSNRFRTGPFSALFFRQELPRTVDRTPRGAGFSRLQSHNFGKNGDFCRFYKGFRYPRNSPTSRSKSR